MGRPPHLLHPLLNDFDLHALGAIATDGGAQAEEADAGGGVDDGGGAVAVVVDFEVFVEIAQFCFGEGGDLVEVGFFGGFFGGFLGFGEFHGGCFCGGQERVDFFSRVL